MKNLVEALGIKQLVLRSAGHGTYRRFRSIGLACDRRLVQLTVRLQQRRINSSLDVKRGLNRTIGGLDHAPTASVAPVDAFRRNYVWLRQVLDSSGLDWWVVSDVPYKVPVVAISSSKRERFLEILHGAETEFPVYVTGLKPGVPAARVQALGRAKWIADAEVLRIVAPTFEPVSGQSFGAKFGCDIEFWDLAPEGDTNSVAAPRENRAARTISTADFVLGSAPSRIDGVGTVKTPAIMEKRMLDDIDFPIDVVYTWVDGEDPLWIASKNRTEAVVKGIEYHPEANHAARFRSRDELKYSLRSLELYAPWVRNIFIVTSGQVPAWLDADHPRIKLVTHAEIYDDPTNLPTFNSNSIISRLHHIPGLSEHYIYVNDDVFFGRLLRPEQFFVSNGIAKVSPSNNRRPFGNASALDEPHLNLTRNMRRLLEEEFGITISRAIKHTPHPQIKSVHFEMENRFLETYKRTWASHFRHHSDIVSDQLHHYYAQITGKAVTTRLRYNYINILDDKYRSVMQGTLQYKNRDTFCINDAPVEGATPIPDDEVTAFLEAYFPQPSSFEISEEPNAV